MQSYSHIIQKILNKAKKDGDIVALSDAWQMTRALEVEGSSTVIGVSGKIEHLIYNDSNFERSHRLSSEIRETAYKMMGVFGSKAVEIYFQTLLFDAPHDFDAYLLYMEKNREPDRKFYVPRRKQLLPVVKALQELETGKINLLGISEPPGVGKTTVAEFFMTWTAGRNPQLPSLIGSHSNSFLNGMYGELLRMFDPEGEYLFNDVFPNVRVINTRAKDLQIDLGRDKSESKRFSTIEHSSIGSQNAGKVRAMNILYCDDLVPDIETAMSKERLDKLWQQYYTDLRQRKVGNRVKELHIATRWSVWDVIGRLEEMCGEDGRSKFIRFAAMDENDESNFDYPYGLGYTTDDLRKQRSIMDDASWKALYMNEPVEREGLLYEKDELRRYFALPEQEPDDILAVIDSKEQGTDYLTMPVAYRYGNEFYIDTFICDNSKIEFIEDRVADTLVNLKVKNCRIESNRGGSIFAQNIEKKLKERNGITNITTKWSQQNKETRIQASSGWAKKHFLFKDETIIQNDKEYREAIKFLTTYTMAGKNKHDDVPDSLSMLVDFATRGVPTKATFVSRKF